MADFLKKHWFRFLICILLVAGCIVVYNIFNSYENEETGKIDTIIEKPSIEDAPSTCAGLGRYIVKPEIFDILEHLSRGVGNEYQFTDAMKELMTKQDFYACIMDATYYDTGNKLGYIKANIDYALDREDLKEGLQEYLNSLKEKY